MIQKEKEYGGGSKSAKELPKIEEEEKTESKVETKSEVKTEIKAEVEVTL